MLGKIIAGFLITALVSAAINGRLESLGAAALSGAQEAAALCISLAGLICLWSAVMEVMSQSGLTEKLSRLLRPLLSRLYPAASRDGEVMEALSANLSANLLGLGNAATPAGIRAAKGLQLRSGSLCASNELCLLVVMNTASVQLIPSTVASIRASLGCGSPFDILPAVWCASLVSVTVGVLSTKLLSRFFPPC